MSLQQSVADQLEDTIEAVAEQIVAWVNDFLKAWGPRPIFAEAGDPVDLMMAYLAIRDDPAAWQMRIAQRAQVVGQKSAEYEAWREASEMERRIERAGGYDAVRYAAFERRMQRGVAAAEKAERVLDQPKARVLGPVPPVDEMDLLAAVIDARRQEQEEAAAMPWLTAA